MDIKKKLNVSIFGSTGSIGSYLAKKYSENSNNVNLFYRKRKSTLNLENFKYKNPGKINFIKYNSSNEKEISECVRKNKKDLIKTDILIITIAEQGQIENFFKNNLIKFKKTFFVNFFLYVYLIKNLIKYLKKNKKLLIIFFAGGGSTSYRKNFSSYSLSKISLVKFTEIISNEVNSKKIRINIISPGIIYSNLKKLVIKNKKKITKSELIKLKKNIKNTDKNLENIFKTINFLYSKTGEKITGKFISSAWDNIYKMKKKNIDKIILSDLYTLRRKEF